MKFFVSFTVSGIDASIADHLEMLLRDVADEPFDKLNGGNRFHDIFFVFMTIVVKGDHVSIIAIDSGSCDDRSAEIASDIFYDSFRVAEIGLGVDIESMLVIGITFGLYFFVGSGTCT